MADTELGPHAGITRLKCSKGRTINLGNSESIRIDVGIELEAAVMDSSATYDRMKAWVNARLDADTNKVLEDLLGRRIA